MKTLIWADLHGHNFKEFSTIEDGMNTRLKDCEGVGKRILQSARENNVDGICFVGDLFHLKNNLDNRVIQSIMYMMKELAASYHLLLIPGHHDLYMWSSNPIMMEMLAKFSDQVMLIDRPTFGEFFGSRIYIEPCTRKIKELNERIVVLETDPRQDFFFAHQDILGMHYGKFVVEHGLDADLLSKKFRWSFIGHYHNPEKIKENVISVGAPLQHNFGDAGEKRGWWILDTEKEEVKFIENDFSPSFLDLTIDENVILGDFEPDEKNFYRIKIKNRTEMPSELARIKWKRVSYEAKSQAKKRTTISFSDKREDIVIKYVEARGGNLDHKKLIEIGRKYL